jgi:glycosyltransferase involved in cell wall biosynthesis
MRVLYVARAPFISGAERALASQLRHLDRQQVAPLLVVGHESPLIETVSGLDVPVRVVRLPKRAPKSLLPWWWSLRRLRSVVREFKPDLLHANDVPSCQALSVLGAELHLPRVVHVRWTITAKEAGWWARVGAERVICISQWVKGQFGDTAGTPLANTNVDVLPDAVDWPAKRQSDDDFASTRRPGETVIGFAGQLIPSKGLELVIGALALLPVGDRPKLLVAGRDTQRSGAYQAELEALAERAGVAERIEWLGFLQDVGDLYRRVSAMICPSWEEPLGLVPLEAAQFHLPTIANDIGGLAETIVDGQTGWLVTPTPDAWARALKRLQDRAAVARMGRAAHDRTQTLYAPAVYQQKLVDVYRQLLGDTAGKADS